MRIHDLVLFAGCYLSKLTTPTFYFRVGSNLPGCPRVQTFDDGKLYGPCGKDGQGSRYTSSSKYWAAIKNGGKFCGRKIQLIDERSGNNILLTVMDSCPECEKDDHVDMGLEALVELTGAVERACAIDCLPAKVKWKFADVSNELEVMNKVDGKIRKNFRKDKGHDSGGNMAIMNGTNINGTTSGMIASGGISMASMQVILLLWVLNNLFV